MIKQGILNGSLLEKKFKILRTSILLGNIENREEMISAYEETALEVDKIRRCLYEEALASKMYSTTTLEEERDRLTDLIKTIEDRINSRNEFIDDYIRVTSNYLDNLPRVSGEEELSEYRLRLANIDEFLDNSLKIEELNEKLLSLRNELEEKYENKANNEIINAKLEDELIEQFNAFITSDNYYACLNYTDIDDELARIEIALKEKLDVMNTFISSFEALKTAGISGAEREEYSSYVTDSRVDYYEEAEKKYILNIYKLVLDKEVDYDKLYNKRLIIDNILNERDDVRKNLDIISRDQIKYFADLCREQFSVIKSQKFNIENIDKLIMDISNCEEELSKLESANSRPEILDLLEEYSISSPEAKKVTLPVEEEIHEEITSKLQEEPLIPKAPNMVIKVSDPIRINIKKASDVAKLVMKKVVIVLEPKRFNGRRDKLKEVEEELREEETMQNIPLEKDDKVELDDGESDISLNKDDVKIELPEEDNKVIIPTEIFIDTNKEEPSDLFSDTDPFLDDNEFEIDRPVADDEVMDDMPKIESIGSVKPNNMLDEIDDALNANKDITLPTMGLTDNDDSHVPIVSENYIKD